MTSAKPFFGMKIKKNNLGSLFESHMPEAIESIQSNPLKTQIRYGSTRVFFLKKFPYGIHFLVEKNTILIVAVFHTSRDPERWKGRT